MDAKDISSDNEKRIEELEKTLENKRTLVDNITSDLLKLNEDKDQVGEWMREKQGTLEHIARALNLDSDTHSDGEVIDNICDILTNDSVFKVINGKLGVRSQEEPLKARFWM